MYRGQRDAGSGAFRADLPVAVAHTPAGGGLARPPTLRRFFRRLHGPAGCWAAAAPNRPFVADLQVCLKAVDYVRKERQACAALEPLDATPPHAADVRNAVAAHVSVVPSLGRCYWDTFTAAPSTGGILYYEWGIGRTPHAPDVLPFRFAQHTRAGAVPPLDAAVETPYYCIARGVTLAMSAATAASPPFFVCPTQNATVVAGRARHPGAAQAERRRLCASWALPAPACVARREWAVGRVPYGVSAQPFTEATGDGACAAVDLVDGGAYYVSLRLTLLGGAQQTVVSAPLAVDGSAPEVEDVRLVVAGAGLWEGAQYVNSSAADVTVAWSVREPHADTVDLNVTVLADGAVAAAVHFPSANASEGEQTFIGVDFGNAVAVSAQVVATNGAGLQVPIPG